MSESGHFRRERQKILNEIKKLPPGPKALKQLAFVRQEYDWAIPDYRNTLNILSDTTYQDRKHFLLELIQNADDAQFISKEAELSFIIREDSIELRYNEKGFNVEDVIAITGTGASTKAEKNRLANSFIGEKGIGFKSVFALASDVEIESPPWHFLLRKEKCIVPEAINSGKLKKGEGTRLKVRFSEAGVVDTVAAELQRYVSGQVESFLFLQRLSRFKVEDHRCNPKDVRNLILNPANRSGNALFLHTLPDDKTREYLLYEEEAEFPDNLVAERWERLGPVIGSLKRKLIVAALVNNSGDFLPQGRLFCFLPTEVRLPVPLYLQVDGHTKADRERLHAPFQNRWNLYLLSLLPDFLLRAILNCRFHSTVARRLPDYIPTDEGTDQLATVFKKLAELLKSAPWVRTLDEGEDGWVSPDMAVLVNKYWMEWFADPAFREKAETLLGKKFVHPEWADNQDWKSKWAYYRIPKIDDLQIAIILEGVALPAKILNEEDHLIELYKQLVGLSSLHSSQPTPHSAEVRERLARAAIFPLEGGKVGPLKTKSNTSKIFWISGTSRRRTGLKGTLNYRIVNPDYTYRSEPGGEASQERIAESRRINSRNEVVRELLKRLGVPELTDENILSRLQVPWLIDPDRVKDNTSEARFRVLSSIFQAYRAKRSFDDEYFRQLSLLSNAIFPSEKGVQRSLKEQLLPPSLRLQPEDLLYPSCGLDVLKIPADLLEPSASKAKKVNQEREQEKRKKLKEDWRQFLILCGIKNYPEFILKGFKYLSVWDFEDKCKACYEMWQKQIKRDCTYSRPVEVKRVEIDNSTKSVLESDGFDSKLMAKILYNSWLKAYKDELKFIENSYYWHKLFSPPAGYFLTKYKRRETKISLTKDFLWGGIKRDRIPLLTINNNIVNSNDAFRVLNSQKNELKTAARYLPLVLESQEEGTGYHPAFLESLNVPTLKISDINSLWSKVEKEFFPEIIKIAIEFLHIRIPGTGLELFDQEEKQIRLASDFRLGREGAKGVPLIEKQYGDIGRILGELLGLVAENEFVYFLGIFEKLLSADPTDEERFLEDIYRLLKHWQSWDTRSRGAIASDFQGALEKYDDSSPPIIVFNNPETLALLKNAGIKAFGLMVDDSEKYGMERAARELGLSQPDNAGVLELAGERPLNDPERKRFNQLVQGYINSLEWHEISRLTSKLTKFGSFDQWDTRIRKVESADRLLGKSNQISIILKLPYMDDQRHQLLVGLDNKPETILAHLLSVCDFTRFKSALRDIKDIQLLLEPATKLNSGYSPPLNVPESNEHEKSDDIVKVVAGEVRTALKSDQAAPEHNNNQGDWKTGLAPEDEEDLRKRIGVRLIESLQSGPEIHEKKIRRYSHKAGKILLGENEKIVDPGAADPKAFLKTEYNGKCQICATELQLSNGQKWFEIFRIRESRGEIWWADRPFNILCMCPNCHALAKYGGGRDLDNIYIVAKELLQGITLPEEVIEHRGDFYVVPVKINGINKRLVMSKAHLNHFAALFESAEEVATTTE